jgi:Ni2+-binding GTPase involved in maturation of urease and hydrogenase
MRKNAVNDELKSNLMMGGKDIVHSIIESLMRPEIRVINVVGPEGIGKTRVLMETIDYLRLREELY